MRGAVLLVVSVMVFLLAGLAGRVERGLMAEARLGTFALVFVAVVALAVMAGMAYSRRRCKKQPPE